MANDTPGRRAKDRVRVRTIRERYLERRCAFCDDWFEVAHNRPDADYCPENACKMRRRYARRKAEAASA